MKNYSLKELSALRHRFIEDSGINMQNVPDPYFTQRIHLFEKEFNTLTDYNIYTKYVEETFNGNIQQFLEFYHSLRDKIIGDVSGSKAFRDFCDDDTITREIREFNPIIGNRNLYTQEQVNDGDNCFLSLDMKKANFQTLKWINPAIVYDCETYEQFIGRYTDMEWAAKSKRTREIIFGKLNPNRTMKYERILMGMVENYVRKTIITDYFYLFSMNSDELIYKLKPGLKFEDAIKAVSMLVTEDNLHINLGLHLRMEFFKLKCYNFKTKSSDRLMNVFVKEHHDGKKTYKCANETYFPQTYKLINGIEVTDDDLVFYYDKAEIAKFMSPITMVNN